MTQVAAFAIAVLAAIVVVVAVGLLGAFLRLLFGGGPHYRSEEDPTKKRRAGWLPRPFVYLIGFGFAFLLMTPLLYPLTLIEAGKLAVLAGLVMLAWSPGHGSYLTPGSYSRDNEQVGLIVRPLGKLLKMPQGSARYCHLGMAIRYGLFSALIALAAGLMFGWTWLLMFYAVSGFAMGFASDVIWKGQWAYVERQPWFDPVHSNWPIEVAIGAITFTSLLFLPL